MAVSLVCGILAARLVLSEAGVEEYALMTMLIALPSMLTFSDLGAGAVLVNTVASTTDARQDELLLGQARSVARVIVGFALTMGILSTILLVSGTWDRILGSASVVPHAAWAAWVCSMVYCVTTSLGLWQRILLGMGKNHLIVLLQGIVSPLSLLAVWLLITADLGMFGPFLALGTFVAMLCVAVSGTVVADRHTAPLLRRVARELLLPRRYPGARVMHVGWPMLVQLLTNPLSVVLPRYILAQVVTPVALAQYALAGQVFFALQALIATAGVSLWPMYSKSRAEGSLHRGPYLMSLGFGLGAAVATAVVVTIGPWFFTLVSEDQLEVPTDLIVAFGAMTVAQATVYPLGMFLMDPAGIRFQVLPAIGMTISTVIITSLTAPTLGVRAPLLAYGASVVVFQIIPYLVYIRRNRGRLHGKAL